MTRILSEILQAPEPFFSTRLRQLEQASGHKSADIRLSVEITHAVQYKIKQLGLDQHDTTSKELYQALLSRVSADDRRLERSLRTLAAHHVSAEANLMDGMAFVLTQDAQEVTSYSIKTATLKRLLKKTAPKRVLKQLSYRSLDSMLRSESVATIVAAAQVLESAAWQRNWLEGYRQLKTSDFDDKAASIATPQGKRWEALAQKIVAEQGTTVVGLPELGTVVLLPLPATKPDGAVVATLATALHDLNVMASHSSYLRASQPHADFADRVKQAAKGSVSLPTPILEQPMSWELVQRYFAKLQDLLNEDVFGPYVQANNFIWKDVEARMADICPSLAFWQGSEYLSYLHDGKAVSLNVLDVAVDACNRAMYESRAVMHAQQALWHELTTCYLDRESLEEIIMTTLQPKLAFETAK